MMTDQRDSTVRALLAAVMRQAIRDAADAKVSAADVADARAWIEDPHRSDMFSYRGICAALELPAIPYGELMRRYRQQKRPAG